MRLVLASTSPQRRAILHQLAIPFEVVAPRYDEKAALGSDAVELVRAHASGKARSVHAGEGVTLGVDTAVQLDGEIYGKPSDTADAARMLQSLSGRTHAVVSGLCVIAGALEIVDHAATAVRFAPLDERFLSDYLASGEWESRAGAYAIQGLGSRFVERIDGDYLNVVGLPGAMLLRILSRHAPRLLVLDPNS